MIDPTKTQTLPVVPAEKRGTWNPINDALLLLFGVMLGAVIGFTDCARTQQQKTVYEHLTDDDRAELNQLVGRL